VRGDGLQPVRDLDQIRGFLSGLGPTALFDLPWMPVYLGIVYVMHPWLGMLGAAGALVLIVLTILTEARSRAPTREAAETGAMRQALGEAIRRNAEAIRALGMGARLSGHWSRLNERHLSHQVTASDVVGGYGSITKVLRMVLQSAVLGLGAYLVIVNQATPGVMIAASILVSRALAPIEIAIANWRGFIAARQSWERLGKVLPLVPADDDVLALPKPKDSLAVEGLWVAAPGQQPHILQNVSLTLKAGAGLGIIGPSASGKSTLARAMVGAWAAQRGVVRLDGSALDQWPPEVLGRHVGYLPQDIELFAGTVAQNIARFDPEASSDTVLAAARQAGVHDLIAHLPNGYETEIGEGGSALSAGQRQRVALARALCGDPFLVVLDEPNSNLDAAGDTALTAAVSSVRARGGIIVVIAHRPSALAGLDQLLVLADGQVKAFGPKDEVLRKAVQTVTAASSNAAAPHLKVINEGPDGGA
jgi:ATP-binding cassette subfamily C protein